MNRRLCSLATVALVIGLLCGLLPAGSIWDKGHARTQSILTDDIARHVGDTLTITINEKSEIANETSRKMDKTGSREMKVDGTVDLRDLIPALRGKIFELPDVNASSSAKSNFDGSADYDSSRKVVDQVSVTVEDVLPNGNLLILGKRTREIAGDTQIVQISGIVRPSDIAFDNSVKSEKVAQFHIIYKRKGQEKMFFNPGWLGRILNFLNPF